MLLSLKQQKNNLRKLWQDKSIIQGRERNTFNLRP